MEVDTLGYCLMNIVMWSMNIICLSCKYKHLQVGKPHMPISHFNEDYMNSVNI